MTWSIHSIVWRDAGNEEAAAENFFKSYTNYSHGPFYTWHEGAAPAEGSDDQGAPYLITGAGGFLQTVWAGYGGVRFEEAGVLSLRKPAPLPGSTHLRLRGLHFLGARLDVCADMQGWSVALSSASPVSAPALEVLATNGTAYSLLPGGIVYMPAGQDAKVRRASSD